jgi:hypothetical protein
MSKMMRFYLTLIAASSSASKLLRLVPFAHLAAIGGHAMRLARKLPPVRPLSGLLVHLCGRCGYVGANEREPEPPPPKWLRPTNFGK